MTEHSAPLRTHAPTSPLARALRLALTAGKSFFRSRPSADVDLRHVNDRFLRDIGLRR